MPENAVQALNNVKPAPFSSEWLESQQTDYNAIKLARQRGDYDEYMAGRPIMRDPSVWESMTDSNESYFDSVSFTSTSERPFALQYTSRVPLSFNTLK